MKICFYANLSQHQNWREMFEKVEFYRVDIHLLRSLGHEVLVAGRPQDLDLNADLYYCWWWGHAPIPILFAAFRKKPVLVTGAFDYATCRDEIPGMCYLDRPFWQKCILRFSLRFSTSNLFISSYEKNEVTKNLHVKNPVLAPLAVNTDFYKPTILTNQEPPYFFTVSWTSRTNIVRKGIQQTIEAFSLISKKLPNIRLKLAGKAGDGDEDLRAFVKKHDLEGRVDFLGMISEEDKLKCYQGCIAYVQPTLYEGFGLAIAEAIACGCRVVTSNRGAVPEVSGRFGICVDPKNITAIADAMADCANNRADSEYKLSAHNWIKLRFSLESRRACLKKLLDHYL